MLDRVEALAKETPPVDNATSRFGNPAFKTFYDKVLQVRTCVHACVCVAFRADGVWTKAAPQLHEALPAFPAEAIPEVSGYLVESWGNRTRIDYGSGMELNFLCWLCVSFL